MPTSSLDRELRRLKEQVEILWGSRGAADRMERAVRLRELGDAGGSSITKVSQLENDAGYVDASGAAAAAPIQSLVEGANITIDVTDPANPVISAAGGALVANWITEAGDILATEDYSDLMVI